MTLFFRSIPFWFEGLALTAWAARPYRHVRERSHETKSRSKSRMRRMKSRIFDVKALDGTLEELLKDEMVGSQPVVRRHSHSIATEVARRILERRRHANTAPARIESGMEKKDEDRTCC